MDMQIFWGWIGFLFFLMLWAVLPARLRRRVTGQPTIPAPAAVRSAAAVETDTSTHAPSPPAQERERIGELHIYLTTTPTASGGYAVAGHLNGFTFTVPVHSSVHRNGRSAMRQEAFWVDLLGMRIIARSLRELLPRVETVLQGLMWAGHGPAWAVRVHLPNRTVCYIPVYPNANGWSTHIPDGPVTHASDAHSLLTRIAVCMGVSVDACEPVMPNAQLQWTSPVGYLHASDHPDRTYPVFLTDGTIRVVGVDRLHTYAATAPIRWLEWAPRLTAAFGRPMMLVITDIADTVYLAETPSAYAFRCLQRDNGRLRSMQIPVWHIAEHHVAVIHQNGRLTLCAAPQPDTLRLHTAHYLVHSGQIPEPDDLQWVPPTRLRAVSF